MEIPKIIHESWHSHLQPLFDDKKMQMVKDIVFETPHYPEGLDIWKVFRMPLDYIRVVILGQDPYHDGSATGLAFANPPHLRMSPSLGIIRKELIESFAMGIGDQMELPLQKWQTLEHWENQGVFLLNPALTVVRGQADTHTGIWLWFSREVVRIISEKGGVPYSNNHLQNGHIKPVWLLWGSKARAFLDYINLPWNGVRPKKEIEEGYQPDPAFFVEANVYLTAYHPAAETRPDSKYKFTGCNHFNLCNEILKRKGNSIINW